MNKIAKFTALVLALICLLSVGACGDNAVETPETEKTVTYLSVFDAGSDYKMVRPDEMSESGIETFKKLKNAILETYGVDIPLETDWDVRSDLTQAHEILVGNTTRPESAEALAKIDGKGYIITVIRNKIVIAATSQKYLDTAVTKFIETYVSAAGSQVPSDLSVLFIESREDNPLFQFDAVTLNGVNIKDYTVVVSNLKTYDLPLYTVTSFFYNYANVTLTGAAEANAGAGHKIVIGGKKADGTDYTRYETEIWYKDGDLHLGCANATMAQKAIYTFIDQYFNTPGAVAIEIPADGTSLFHSAEADNWDDADPKDILSIQDRIVRGCYKLQAILELDHANGKYYTYQNKGYPYSLAEARETGNRTTNCVIVANWVAIDAGFFDHGIFNIVYDGTTGYMYEFGSDEGSAEWFCTNNMEMLDMRTGGGSIRELYEDGRLYPGDIIFFNGHMQIVMPHMTAFDAGRMNTEKVAAGSKFLAWERENQYPYLSVGFILRDKQAQPE